MRQAKLFSAVLSVAAFAAVGLWLSRLNCLAGQTGSPDSMKSAPGWQLQDLSGKTVRSADFKGKVVILDFWATWCPPCRAEIPGFIELQKKYQAQGLAIVGVSVDQASTDSIRSFVQKQGLNYPVVQSDEKIEAAYGGIEGLPTTFIIDWAGHIVKRHLGFTDQAEFEKEIKPLLSP